jgi:putative protease
MSHTLPELLAPAGDGEALRAAVANGADAVYFGLDTFNARQRATNFTLAKLPQVVAYLHDHNVRGYVTLNTLLFSDELPRAAEYVGAIAQSGADAIIVQDLGLIRLIRRLAPTLPIHASTQMTQTEAEGLELLRTLGVSRAIVARELTLAELARLAAATPLPLEVFVHGALCISYSGQCLASEALWGRSANRGQCGQACRLPYQQLVVDGQAVAHADREYLLSAQDLAAYDRIPELARLGIAAVKIEGRLKSPHYVAATTRMYRAALDAAARGTPFVPSREHEQEVVESFSRGFSHGYLDGLNHQQLVHGHFPHKRGVHVGTVVGQTAHGVLIEWLGSPADTPPLKPGDGVVFDEGHPGRDEQGGRVYAVTPVASRAELTFGAGDLNLAAISTGSKVWKTDDPALRRRLESSYARDAVPRRVPVDFVVTVQPDNTLEIVLRDTAGQQARVTWDEPLAAAQKHPLSVELLRAQLGRLGDTPFELAALELRGASGPCEALPVMAPKSVLNELRRRAVEMLRNQRTAAVRHAIAEPHALDTLRGLPTPPANEQPAAAAQLNVLVRDLRQLEAVLSGPAAVGGMVYCDFHDSGDYVRAVELARAAGRSIALATPHVLMPDEMGALDQITAARPAAVLVRSLGALRCVRALAPDLTLIGDYALNVANDLTAAVLTDWGLARLTPGLDLNWPQWAALRQHVPAERLEVVLHQHVPLFHTRHCLFAAALSGGPHCGDCGWLCRSHDLALRDRNGVAHPVLADGLGRNTVFHAAAQTAAEHVSAMRELGLRHFRVDLLRESPDQVRALLDLYARLLDGLVDSAMTVRQLRAVSPGGMTAGTWAEK